MTRSPAPAAPKRRLRSIEEAADYLGVNPRTIRRYLTESRLTAYRVGNKLLRVDMVEVESLAVVCAPHEVSK